MQASTNRGWAKPKMHHHHQAHATRRRTKLKKKIWIRKLICRLMEIWVSHICWWAIACIRPQSAHLQSHVTPVAPFPNDRQWIEEKKKCINQMVDWMCFSSFIGMRDGKCLISWRHSRSYMNGYRPQPYTLLFYPAPRLKCTHNGIARNQK